MEGNRNAKIKVLGSKSKNGSKQIRVSGTPDERLLTQTQEKP